jgi:hypothetical protein
VIALKAFGAIDVNALLMRRTPNRDPLTAEEPSIDRVSTRAKHRQCEQDTRNQKCAPHFGGAMNHQPRYLRDCHAQGKGGREKAGSDQQGGAADENAKQLLAAGQRLNGFMSETQGHSQAQPKQPQAAKPVRKAWKRQTQNHAPGADGIRSDGFSKSPNLQSSARSYLQVPVWLRATRLRSAGVPGGGRW